MGHRLSWSATLATRGKVLISQEVALGPKAHLPADRSARQHCPRGIDVTSDGSSAPLPARFVRGRSLNMSRATPKPCPRQADAVAGPETHSRSAPALRRGVVALDNQAGGCACAAPARIPQAKPPSVPLAHPSPGEHYATP